jgi:hypothetical protein
MCVRGHYLQGRLPPVVVTTVIERLTSSVLCSLDCLQVLFAMYAWLMLPGVFLQHCGRLGLSLRMMALQK